MIPSNVWRMAQAWGKAHGLISGPQEGDKPDTGVVAIGEEKTLSSDSQVKPTGTLENPIALAPSPAKPPAKRRR